MSTDPTDPTDRLHYRPQDKPTRAAIPTTMNTPTAQNDPATRLILHLADDALIYGQRLSEWCSRGPTLELDIALSNTALSYLGRARMLFAQYSELMDEGHDEDHYAMLRSEREYTNLWIYEIDNGDFAFTSLRQYWIDLFECHYFKQLSSCSHQGLAAVAAKAVLESRFSITRSRNWLDMLAGGTAESQRRLQQAVNDLWGYASEFFIVSEAEKSLAATDGFPDRVAMEAQWQTQLQSSLTDLGLNTPESPRRVSGGRLGIHSDALGHLLSDLQYMQRSLPGLKW